MNEIFISYASENRTTALMIANILRERGFGVWIDQYKIPGGENWSPAIISGIKDCALVLAIVSRDCVKAEGVAKELSFAGQRHKKIIPLYIEEDIELPDNLAWWLEERQRINAYGDQNAWLPPLLAALPMVSETPPTTKPAGAAGSANPQQGARLKLPYFADRDAQEKRIYTELYAHFASRPDRPIFFILSGDQSQCVDGFIDRLRLDTLPRYLKQLNLCDQLEWKNISWPRPLGPNDTAPAQQRADAYRLDLTKSLEISPASAPRDIATKIDNLRMSVLFTSTIDASLWRPEEPDVVKRVIYTWSEVPQLAQHGAAIVFISIVLRQPKETFLTRLFAPRPATSEVSSVAEALKSASHNLTVVLLPELADVSQVDIREWVRQYLRPDDLEEAMRQVDKAYREQRIRIDQVVPMEKALPILKELAFGPLTAREA